MSGGDQNWQVGDLALCVNDGPVGHYWVHSGIIRCGGIYKVELPFVDHDGDHCLLLEQHHSGNLSGGWLSCRFRKIDPHTADEEDAETIRLLTGQPVTPVMPKTPEPV